MIWRRLLVILLVLVVIAAAAAEAKPLLVRVGQADGGGGSRACGSGVCAQFQNGQTFITWTDLDTGAAGNDWRYSVYRSTSPITSGNFGSAKLIASYVLNNSGQLFGGNPASGGLNPYTQSYKQSASNPMSVLTDLGTPLAPFTGLQVYTALGAAKAYYAVVAHSCPAGTCPAGPNGWTAGGAQTYVGSVGPIAESVATPQAIKWADSNNRGQSYGKMTGLTGLPVVFRAHASGAGSGCPAIQCQSGDYWQMWLTPGEGWQDGRPAIFDVAQDNAQHAPSLSHSLEVIHRDTIWNPLGTTGMETYHIGLGMTPNPLVGPANRYYPMTARAIARELNWVIAHYNADPNQVHWKGQSMGGWGGAVTGLRMTSPRISALWLAYPIWRPDRRARGNWPGKTWTSAMPFKAALGAAPSTLGKAAANVLLDDGSTWGGPGGYADSPGFIAANPGSDLPFAAWNIGKYDPYPASFLEQIEAKSAFQSARRGHAFVWATMGHESTPAGLGDINCDATLADSAICYGKPLFKLNAPYIAFTNSSIDDHPGTATPTANGLLDGDYQGCINCGHKWNIESDTSGGFNFSVSNAWMTRPPTSLPQTTLTGSMTSSGSGSVAVANSAGFQSIGLNPYVLVGGTEIVKITSTADNMIAFSARGMFGTRAQAHGVGQMAMQLISKPTGPNGGPYTTMTVDVTPRRRQNFLPAEGSRVGCTITPFGAASTVQRPIVRNGLFTLAGVTINSGEVTSVACR